jgi:hypothetical protein
MRNETSSLHDRSGSNIGARNAEGNPTLQRKRKISEKSSTDLWPIEKTIPLLLNSFTADITPLISGAAVTIRTPH